MSPLKSTVEQLLARVAQLEKLTGAENRTTGTEQGAARFDASNGNGAATSYGHSISRREALLKAAVAGAAGLGAGVLLKPKDAEAAYSVQGDAANTGTNPTTIATRTDGLWNGSVLSLIHI